MYLNHTTILILSPQSWGTMHVSKHHYALELARKGNEVYFLNPPSVPAEKGQPPVRIRPTSQEGLFLIDHRLWFPYNIKFHAIRFFHFLMKFHLRRVLKTIGKPIDIVWSFDLGNLYPFQSFSRARRIFHPVDEPHSNTAIRSAAGAEIIFSVTREILGKYRSFDVPAFFINHGLAKEFVTNGNVQTKQAPPYQVGFSGNLIRNDIDRKVLLQIISQNRDIHFHFWGSYQLNQSNISGANDPETVSFIQQLKDNPNVTLHGPVASGQLAAAIQQMDAFLICYDIRKDQSKGTNYHKVMEYLGTGKVIVSNNITTYQDQPGLLEMAKSRDNNHELPDLFKKVMSNLALYNSVENQQARISFAHNNQYSKQVERIEEILVKTFGPGK